MAISRLSTAVCSTTFRSLARSMRSAHAHQRCPPVEDWCTSIRVPTNRLSSHRERHRTGDFMSVVAKALLAKLRSESARADVDEIHRFTQGRSLNDGRKEALTASLPPGPAPSGDAFATARPTVVDPALMKQETVARQTRERAYVRARISSDTAVIRSALADIESWQLVEGISPKRVW